MTARPPARPGRRVAGLLAAGLAALVLAATASCSGSTGSSGSAGSAGSASGGDGGGGAASVSPERKGTFAGAMFATPQPRPAFTLTGTDGLPYDFQAHTRGRPTLLYFGYTHCPDVCPTTMADVATALRDVPAQVRAKVTVVFVTTDPRRDTPAVLGEWLRHFDADLPTRFVGLTGTRQQVQAAQQAAGVPMAQDDGKTHSTQLLLYGPDDVSRVFYLAGSAPEDLGHDLPIVAEGRQR